MDKAAESDAMEVGDFERDGTTKNVTIEYRQVRIYSYS